MHGTSHGPVAGWSDLDPRSAIGTAGDQAVNGFGGAREAAALIGTRVSHYSVVALIGEGGMGRVYRARDERLQRDVAIKVLGASADTERGRKGLIAEARALSRVSHAHIAAIHDFVTENGRDHIVMELVPGATLKEVLAAGPLPLSEVLRLGRQLASGLGAAHAAHVVHRDIKPANLKVTTSGDLKILDFGLAVVLPGGPALEAATDVDSRQGLAGTAPYMSPEQLRGEPTDERSDVFSAGAVLYEMATGRPAFPQRQLACLIDAILHQSPARLSGVNPFMPLAFDRVVMKAMDKRPEYRQPSAAVLLEELDAVAAPGARMRAGAQFDDLAAALVR